LTCDAPASRFAQAHGNNLVWPAREHEAPSGKDETWGCRDDLGVRVDAVGACWSASMRVGVFSWGALRCRRGAVPPHAAESSTHAVDSSGEHFGMEFQELRRFVVVLQSLLLDLVLFKTTSKLNLKPTPRLPLAPQSTLNQEGTRCPTPP